MAGSRGNSMFNILRSCQRPSYIAFLSFVFWKVPTVLKAEKTLYRARQVPPLSTFGPS